MWGELLFPVRCAGCGCAAPAGLCQECLAAAPVALAVPPLEGLDACYAALSYEGPVREAVARVKYRNARAPVELLAALVDAVLPPLGAAEVDLVTWIPASEQHRRQRGFDHAALLARAVARRRHRPVAALLRRVDRDRQTARSRAGREVGPTLAPRRRPPRRVLLVDDVTTTGATLRNAARVLRGEGCETVIGAVVARTLLKRSAVASESHADGCKGGPARDAAVH